MPVGADSLTQSFTSESLAAQGFSCLDMAWHLPNASHCQAGAPNSAYGRVGVRVAIFQRLVVVLDRSAPSQGAFAHTLDWARRLQLPIFVVTLAADENRLGANGREDEFLQSCADACEQLNIAWQRCHDRCRTALDVEQLLRPTDLLVFGHALPATPKTYFLRQLQRTPTPAVLVCPDTWSPLSRILLLDQDMHTRRQFFAQSLELARRFGIVPIVLTVARSERKAWLQQQRAREIVAEYRMKSDFDFVVGHEIRAAVESVARWRRCQLVVLDREHNAPWWRWLRSSTIERLISLRSPLAFLVLPGASGSELLLDSNTNAVVPREVLA